MPSFLKSQSKDGNTPQLPRSLSERDGAPSTEIRTGRPLESSSITDEHRRNYLGGPAELCWFRVSGLQYETRQTSNGEICRPRLVVVHGIPMSICLVLLLQVSSPPNTSIQLFSSLNRKIQKGRVNCFEDTGERKLP